MVEGRVWRGVVGIADSLGELRPSEVLGRGEKSHAPVPISPPGFELTVAGWIASQSGRPMGAGDSVDGGKELGEKFGGGVGVDRRGRAATEVYFVEESGGEGCGEAVG